MSRIDYRRYTRTRLIRWLAFSAPVFAFFDWAVLAQARFDPDLKLVLAWLVSLVIGIAALVIAYQLPEKDWLADKESGINDGTTIFILLCGMFYFVLELLLLVGVWSL